MSSTEAPPRPCVVVGREDAADGVVTLTLRDAEGAPLPEWDAGAHVDLVLPDAVRQYSLCGAVGECGEYRIAVLREPESRGGSEYVHDRLAVGATVEVGGPRNHFAFEPAERYVFIAGGIGITPILPMIERAIAAGAEWELFYGGRSRASMAFVDRLTELGDRVHVLPQDEVGLLDLVTALADVERADTLTYCCGPEPLLAAVEGRCGPAGLARLRVERFSSDVEIDRVGDQPFEVELVQTGVTLTVEPGVSILDAVLDAGVDVDSSCEEGTCGTCETDVLEGVPDHRDVVLTDAEQAAGAVMMICVSRCRSKKLVLDL
ncbi:MAG: PDR/VanB family oxidoreductase [Patulibacter sp.]